MEHTKWTHSLERKKKLKSQQIDLELRNNIHVQSTFGQPRICHIHFDVQLYARLHSSYF